MFPPQILHPVGRGTPHIPSHTPRRLWPKCGTRLLTGTRLLGFMVCTIAYCILTLFDYACSPFMFRC